MCQLSKDIMQQTVKLLDKQMDFLDSKVKFTLYSGGRGSGKSQVLAWAAFREACKPNNLVLLIRKCFSDLQDTTLKSLFEIIPPNCIEDHNKSSKTIKIRGGGIIIYRGLDRSTSVRSMNSGCLCIDEIIEFNENEIEELLYGLRSSHGSRQFYAATNPGSPDPDNWIYKNFFINKDSEHKVITSSSYDNHYLPADFFNMFKYMDESRKKRMVMGEWVAIEGQVFNNFSRSRHVRKLEKKGYEEYYLGMDWGQTHAAAFILCGVTKGNVYVIEEVAKSNMLIDQIKKYVIEVKDKYPSVQILYDPSAPVLANELNNVGVGIMKANNDKLVGIDRIRNHLGNGTLFIDTYCTNLIREFENYCYKAGTEIPVKKGDDCFIGLTKIITKDGVKNISAIKEKDEVLTHNLYNTVTNSIYKGKRDVYLYRINNSYLIATKEHEIYVNGEKIELGVLCKLFKSFKDVQRRELSKKWNLKEGLIEDIYIQRDTENILSVEAKESKELKKYQELYIETYGLNTKEKYQKDTIYTIKTLILRTMISLTWSVLKSKNIIKNILESGKENILKKLKGILSKLGILRRYGIEVKKVDNGIVERLESSGKTWNTSKLDAQTAIEDIKQNRQLAQEQANIIAQTPVRAMLGLSLELIIYKLYAKYAEVLSLRINTQRIKDVSPVTTLEKITCLDEIYLGSLPVYDISVNKEHNFFANGILVSNCLDALRYVVNSTDDVVGTFIYPTFIDGVREDGLDYENEFMNGE